MPCHRLKHGRPSAREQQVGFFHSCRPRAVCTPFRHLAFWLSGRHLGGRCGRHLHLIRLGRDFGWGFGGDRTCNGGRIRSHWLIRRRRVQQDRCANKPRVSPPGSASQPPHRAAERMRPRIWRTRNAGFGRDGGAPLPCHSHSPGSRLSLLIALHPRKSRPP
jgi:hypothetical protein